MYSSVLACLKKKHREKGLDFGNCTLREIKWTYDICKEHAHTGIYFLGTSYIYIYIYIYKETERERKRENE